MTHQDRAGAARTSSGAGKTSTASHEQDAPAAHGQPSLFADASAERARIAASIAERFRCYGEGTQPTRHNPIAVTLAAQPAQFGFGVPVRAVVDAVCDLAGVLPVSVNHHS